MRVAGVGHSSTSRSSFVSLSRWLRSASCGCSQPPALVARQRPSSLSRWAVPLMAHPVVSPWLGPGQLTGPASGRLGPVGRSGATGEPLAAWTASWLLARVAGVDWPRPGQSLVPPEACGRELSTSVLGGTERRRLSHRGAVPSGGGDKLVWCLQERASVEARPTTRYSRRPGAPPSIGGGWRHRCAPPAAERERWAHLSEQTWAS